MITRRNIEAGAFGAILVIGLPALLMGIPLLFS
jgi:hypothetical protein